MSRRQTPTGRSRRKSAAALPPKSPDSALRTSRRRGSGGVPTAIGDDVSVSTTGSVTSVSGRGLPPPVLKQLLTDIEHPSFGGLARLKNKEAGEGHILSALLNKKEVERSEAGLDSLYGEQGSAVRMKIIRYSQRWKLLERGKYLELLGRLGVTACEHHQDKKAITAGRKKPTKVASTPVSKQAGYIYDLSDEEKQVKPAFTQYRDKTVSDDESSQGSQPPAFPERTTPRHQKAPTMAQRIPDLPPDTGRSCFLQ